MRTSQAWSSRRGESPNVSLLGLAVVACFFACPFLWVLAARSALAQAPSFVVRPVEDGIQIVEGERELGRLPLGRVTALAVRGTAAWVALAAGGVAVVDLTQPSAPREVTRVAEGRVISRLMLTEQELLLVELRPDLRVLDVSDPLRPVEKASIGAGVGAPSVSTAVAAPAVRDAAPRPAPAGRTVARVVQVTRGRVVFDAGAAAGLREGSHVRIVSRRLVEKPDLATGGTSQQPSNEVTAVLRIEQADANAALARLGRGDIAYAGDLAALTDEPLSERIFLPRKTPFSTRAAFRVRPFLGLETSSKPVGILADVYGSYYFDDLPLRIEAGVAPAGFTVGGKDAHRPIVAAGTVAYTTDYFEIGLGAGALVGSRGPCVGSSIGEVSASAPCEDNTGFTINQVLRLGAIDGLSLYFQSSIFSRPEQFVMGVARGEIQLPLTSRLGLFGGGGGGENGWSFGDVGVRTYVGGTGTAGTKVFSASLGYAGIFDGPSGEEVGGPSVAFGIEWRY
jgi:hypothetical protein